MLASLCEALAKGDETPLFLVESLLEYEGNSAGEQQACELVAAGICPMHATVLNSSRCVRTARLSYR